MPRTTGRLTSRDIGLVINTADPYSVEVGRYYAERRRLAPQQVLRVELPVRAALDTEEFEALRNQVSRYFGPEVQALALAWTLPFAVQCNGLTGALALGFDAGLCEQSCRRSLPSPYFNAASHRPFSDFGLRPSMQLAANSVAAAKALVDRGLSADATLGRPGSPSAVAYFVHTRDAARNVRSALFPPPGRLQAVGVELAHIGADELRDRDHVLLVQTGTARVPHLDTLHWLPGGLGDHLTSSGGRLDGATDQTTALAWIASGATASHGAASEPCNHLQKFPHPQLLLMHYLQGETALEAYWKSVAWPQQSVFIGEPLAAPFAPPASP